MMKLKWNTFSAVLQYQLKVLMLYIRSVLEGSGQAESFEFNSRSNLILYCRISVEQN